MLRRRQGATVVAIMKATGWQPHSVRGFLAGVVRSKLGLTLVSEKTGEQRVYRIIAGKAATKSKGKSRRFGLCSSIPQRGASFGTALFLRPARNALQQERPNLIDDASALTD